MAIHGLVDIHGIQAGRIKPGEKHVAYDQQLERIFGIFQTIANGFTPLFIADMLLPIKRITGRTGHYDLDYAFVIVRGIPLGTQFDDLIVKSHADASAHTHNHAFAIRG
ncbi:hypothetical protein SDC9_66691 [bioreactor metagenome]|uniref:Uncharacterized protein n=1 Tax=bioreactor metagenome TaxID=1076179 RepID=A0A644XVM0_9ZZZZ